MIGVASESKGRILITHSTSAVVLCLIALMKAYCNDTGDRPRNMINREKTVSSVGKKMQLCTGPASLLRG